MVKIELKSISVNERLSEETTCYAAWLYVDGKKFAEVGNDGHGGSDRVIQFAKGVTWDDYRKLDERVKAEYPKTNLGEGLGEVETDLELLCGELVGDYLMQKAVKSRLNKNGMFIDSDGKIKGYKLPKGRTMAEVIAHIRAKHPGCQILNEMPLAEATKVYVAWEESLERA